MRSLGKLPARHDPRTLRMSSYLAALTPPPARVDWSRGFNINYGMMLNDSLGDCTEAAKGHAIQIWSLNLGRLVTVPDSIVLAAYESECGYVPSDPSTDQGGVELDVLNDWRKAGFGGHKLLAYADPSPQTALHIRQAIWLFGGVYIGLQLPASAQSQSTWSIVPDDGSGNTAPGSWGGHAVFVPAYDADSLTCITWGQRLRMTWEFWDRYTDESHALLSPDWINSRNVDPSGIALADLQSDLTGVTS